MAWKGRRKQMAEDLPALIEPEKKINIRISSATKDDMRIVCQMLADRICSGYPKSRLVGFCMKEFKISAEVAQNLIDKTFEVIEDDVTLELKREMPLAIHRRMALYEKAFEAGDYRTCLEIMKDMNKLRGLYNDNQDGKAQDALASLVTAITEQAQVMRSIPVQSNRMPMVSLSPLADDSEGDGEEDEVEDEVIDGDYSELQSETT